MSTPAGPLPPELDLLTVEEVQAILHYRTAQGVRDAIHAGRIPAVRVGKRFFIRRSSLLELFSAQERSRQRPSGAQASQIIRRQETRSRRR